VVSVRVIECLKSFVWHQGCEFAAVFVLLTNGSDLRVIEQIHPYVGGRLRAPSDYEGFTFKNLEPGRHTWNPDVDER
jgi:hypothetical protein